ncbi:MAG: YHS domain-containing protein [Candidatus Omnitrophota bacterium]
MFVVAVSVILNIGFVYAEEGHHNHVMGHEDMSAADHDMEGESQVEADEGLGICPVMGGAALKEYSYIHEGKTYYFCCPMCIGEFKKDPEKYISKIKEINLEAYQFGYEPSEIVVKKGDVVRLLVSSRDVTHGVHIKEYGISVRAVKDKVNKVEFMAQESGKFPILCSVYCGRGHSTMQAVLIVEE